jgi:hypothetical protein
MKDNLTPLRFNDLLARALPINAAPSSKPRPEGCFLPNVSQILIRGVYAQTKSFLQGWRVGRELSPFITHLVVDDLALIRLREIDRFSNLMLGHNQCSGRVRGVT